MKRVGVDIIPHSMPVFSPISIENFKQQFYWQQKGMYAFISWSWVEPFVEWIGGRRCLEVMSGCGWLAYALREKGVDLVATDDYSWHESEKWNNPLTEIEKLDAVVAVEKYGSRTDILIMSWPWIDTVAYHTIEMLYKVNPEALVVYIGEGDGGCTADETFFKHFEEIHNKEFTSVSRMFKSWEGLRDRLRLGKFKP